MTVTERLGKVWADENKTQAMAVPSWEISGTDLPREKNVPVALRMSYCPTVYMNCSHQGADLFLGFQISFADFLRLKWYRLWH